MKKSSEPEFNFLELNSADFSKLYSINRSWGCKYLSNPTSVTYSQVFTGIL